MTELYQDSYMFFIEYFLLILKKISFIVKNSFLLRQFFCVYTLFIRPFVAARILNVKKN
jgi:hypothetical protein